MELFACQEPRKDPDLLHLADLEAVFKQNLKTKGDCKVTEC